MYRRGGNYHRIIENIKTINRFKTQYDSPHPILVWQFILFPYNRHQVPEARHLAGELQMEFLLKTAWDTSTPAENAIQVPDDPEAIRYWSDVCSLPWFSPQINRDGKLIGCCIYSWFDFGNVFTSGLRRTPRNKKYLYMKKMVLGKKVPRIDIPCSYCPVYQDMKKNGSFDIFHKINKPAALILVHLS